MWSRSGSCLKSRLMDSAQRRGLGRGFRSCLRMTRMAAEVCPSARFGALDGAGPPARLGLGVVSKKYALTAPYYVYRIAFRSHDIPKLRASHWICLLYTSPSPRDRTR